MMQLCNKHVSSEDCYSNFCNMVASPTDWCNFQKYTHAASSRSRMGRGVLVSTICFARLPVFYNVFNDAFLFYKCCLTHLLYFFFITEIALYRWQSTSYRRVPQILQGYPQRHLKIILTTFTHIELYCSMCVGIYIYMMSNFLYYEINIYFLILFVQF